MKLEIKVCGNTQTLNLKEVCNLQPDYVGLIFYAMSKRYVKFPEIVARVNGCKAKRVGVFVNESLENINQYVEYYALDVIQLHGDETAAFCQKVSKIKPIFKAFLINDKFNFNILNSYKSSCNKFLFDTSSKLYGGSGKKFDWQLLNAYKLNIPFILSGGIGPNDVENIKSIQHPMLNGIDLNSGFEIEPGVKNIGKLSAFIKNIRNV